MKPKKKSLAYSSRAFNSSESAWRSFDMIPEVVKVGMVYLCLRNEFVHFDFQPAPQQPWHQLSVSLRARPSCASNRTPLPRHCLNQCQCHLSQRMIQNELRGQSGSQEQPLPSWVGIRGVVGSASRTAPLTTLSRRPSPPRRGGSRTT